MKISKFFNELLLIIIAAIFLGLSFFVSQFAHTPLISINKQSSSVNINTQLTQYFHFGHKRLISSLLWIATILESDHEHYNKKDLNSWMFLRFKSISELEPRFYENYSFGGKYLSIIKNDTVGASLIYDKGLEQYPNDFDLLGDAGFHFYFEVGDFDKSYKIYSKMKTHPLVTPLILNTLARLESHIGNLEVAFELLKGSFAKLPDKSSYLANKINSQLYAIRAEIDLKCLNNHLPDCRKVDLENVNYHYNGKEFVAQKVWIPFATKKK
jgi:tetratricopeptide (TPR) repeat protein